MSYILIINLCALFIERFNMRCKLFPTDGCMDLKDDNNSGKFEMEMKGEPNLQDLLEFNKSTLPLLKKYLGSP